jgi:putative membrane protein
VTAKRLPNPALWAGFFFATVFNAVAKRRVALGVRGYTATMLWVKSFHIVFIASWFAGLFYLPRIFVNLAMVPPESVAERQRLLLMARKLMRFTTLLAVPALALGLWMWLPAPVGWGFGWGPGNGWMHAKLAVVVLILGYHHACGVMLRKFESGSNRHSHVWYRWFNEAPVIMLVVVVVLVVVKPF